MYVDVERRRHVLDFEAGKDAAHIQMRQWEGESITRRENIVCARNTCARRQCRADRGEAGRLGGYNLTLNDDPASFDIALDPQAASNCLVVLHAFTTGLDAALNLQANGLIVIAGERILTSLDATLDLQSLL